MDCPVCYGSYPSGVNCCAKCEFFDSCRYYTATEKKVKSRTHLASYEAMASVIPDRFSDAPLPGEEEEAAAEDRRGMADAIGSFFRYLLELDDYTVGIISEIISPSAAGVRCTVSQLSKLHGCSRQAMHRKMLSIIALHPELSSLFQNILYKLGSGRRRFLRHRAAGTAGV